MFQIGDYIHYSNCGLCVVEEITKLSMSGADSERLYYKLTPVDKRKGTVYTPVDNTKVVMRRAMTKDEAVALVRDIPGIDSLAVPDERLREQNYKNALLSADCRQWVQMIKTLYERKEDRIRHGKKATATEERYFNNAVELLHTELAQAMGMEFQEVEGYIMESLKISA